MLIRLPSFLLLLGTSLPASERKMSKKIKVIIRSSNSDNVWFIVIHGTQFLERLFTSFHEFGDWFQIAK